MSIKICTLFVFQLIVFNRALLNQNDVLDSVNNLLLNGDSDNDFESKEQSTELKGGEPTFENGVWKCGNCDVIDESKLIYTEVNDVNTTTDDDRPIVVQVALSLDGMQCITVATPAGAAVRVESGACADDAVTLAVYKASQFVVNVYGG